MRSMCSVVLAWIVGSTLLMTVASARAEVIAQPMDACPTPHNDCAAACGTTCTYWTCHQDATIPVKISSIPTTIIRAKEQCTERLETVVINRLPLESGAVSIDKPGSGNQGRAGYNEHKLDQLPIGFAANSHACVSQVKTGAACVWQTGNWGSCSATCGGGTQTRTVTCSGAYCAPAAKPADSQSCNTQTCSWLTGAWSGCSASCGAGTQTRSVTCSGAYCDPAAMPASSQACDAGSGSWVTGGWGACSVSGCGQTGTQSRSVSCSGTYACCAQQVQPSTTQACSTSACAGKSCTVAAYSMGETIYEVVWPIADGASVTLYQFYFGNKCSGSNPVNLTCKNGVLSGLQYGGLLGELYTYPIPLDCSGGGSPLMIHLNVNPDHHLPLEFTSPLNGINFDLFGANAKPAPYTPVRISWYRQPEYYFIVLPNAKGEVKGIDELFGNNTKGPDGQFAKDGYLALAKYDGKTADGLTQLSDPDGYITTEDPVLAKLRFWHDDNYDGLPQSGELRTADDLGVELIDLAADENFKETDKYGNDTMLKSVVRTKDKRLHVMFDVWFMAYELKRFEMLKKAGSDFVIQPAQEPEK